MFVRVIFVLYQSFSDHSTEQFSFISFNWNFLSFFRKCAENPRVRIVSFDCWSVREEKQLRESLTNFLAFAKSAQFSSYSFSLSLSLSLSFCLAKFRLMSSIFGPTWKCPWRDKLLLSVWNKERLDKNARTLLVHFPVFVSAIDFVHRFIYARNDEFSRGQRATRHWFTRLFSIEKPRAYQRWVSSPLIA